jgi:uncharacterized membrane protein
MGLTYCYHYTGIIKKTLWAVFLLGCLGGLVFNVVVLALTYLDFPVSLKKRLIIAINFPNINILW